MLLERSGFVSLGGFIGEARRSVDLTQARLAKLAGLKTQDVSEFECGKRLASRDNLNKLGVYLDFDRKDLNTALLLADQQPNQVEISRIRDLSSELIEMHLDPVLLCDYTGRILSANKTAQETFPFLNSDETTSSYLIESLFDPKYSNLPDWLKYLNEHLGDIKNDVLTGRGKWQQDLLKKLMAVPNFSEAFLNAPNYTEWVMQQRACFGMPERALPIQKDGVLALETYTRITHFIVPDPRFQIDLLVGKKAA